MISEERILKKVLELNSIFGYEVRCSFSNPSYNICLYVYDALEFKNCSKVETIVYYIDSMKYIEHLYISLIESSIYDIKRKFHIKCNIFNDSMLPKKHFLLMKKILSLIEEFELENK